MSKIGRAVGTVETKKLVQAWSSVSEKLKHQTEELEKMKLTAKLPAKYISKCDDFLARVQGKNFIFISFITQHLINSVIYGWINYLACEEPTKTFEMLLQ